MTSRDIKKNFGGRIILESTGVRPRPTWIRGEAIIEGDEIVLPAGTAEEYRAFEPEHATRLLLDLGNLEQLGELFEGSSKAFDFQLTDPRRARKFAKEHGLLWHGPGQPSAGEFREALRDWYIAGVELTVTTAMYSKIKESQKQDSAEPVRRFLRMWRDAGLFKHISLSDNDDELLDYACIQLAERISRGLADCTPTFSAACGLLENGERVGEAGDFRFGNDTGSLVGAANYQLASLVSRKKIVRDCEECGEMFFPNDPRHTYHKKCGARKRQRERRAKTSRGQ